MNQTQIEAKREAAVLESLTQHGGSVLLREKFDRAFIEIPGMSGNEFTAHLALTLVTAGLYFPVFVWFAYQRRHRIEIIHVRGDGSVERTFV